MLSLAFATPLGSIESSPDTPDPTLSRPFIQMGLLGGFHLINLGPRSINAIDGTEGLAKASTLGQ